MTLCLTMMEAKTIRATALACVRPGWSLRIQLKLGKAKEGKPSTFDMARVYTVSSEYIAGDLKIGTDRSERPKGYANILVANIHAVEVVR